MKDLKILQINVWGGRIKDGLTRFITDGDYDVVCMQEAVWCENEKGNDFLNLFIDTVDKIKRSAQFDFDFRSSCYGFTLLNGEARCECGNVILSKIAFKDIEEKIVCGDYNVANDLLNFKKAVSDHRYTAQKVILENGLTILNYHGYWLVDPLGNSESTKCMKSVADMIKHETSPIVMCGDLNVVSDAPCMRELDFLADLTKLNDIKTTLRNVRFVKDVACDHVLINDSVVCKKFEVIDAPVSDHRALSVDITI